MLCTELTSAYILEVKAYQAALEVSRGGVSFTRSVYNRTDRFTKRVFDQFLTVANNVAKASLRATKETAHLAGYVLTRNPGEYVKKKLIGFAVDNPLSHALVELPISEGILRSDRATEFVMGSYKERLEAQAKGVHFGCCCLGCVGELGMLTMDTAGNVVLALVFPPSLIITSWLGVGDIVSIFEGRIGRTTDGRALDTYARRLRYILAVSPFVPSRMVLPLIEKGRESIENSVAKKVSRRLPPTN